MSMNTVWLRTNDFKSIGGNKIVRYAYGYNSTPSSRNDGKNDRLVNQRENKAIKYAELHTAITHAVIADRWTHIRQCAQIDPSLGCYPSAVYRVTPEHFAFYEEQLMISPSAIGNCVGFLSRSGYRYKYMPFDLAPESWKKLYTPKKSVA